MPSYMEMDQEPAPGLAAGTPSPSPSPAMERVKDMEDTFRQGGAGPQGPPQTGLGAGTPRTIQRSSGPISPDYGNKSSKADGMLQQALAAVEGMPTGPGGFKGDAGDARSQTRQIKKAKMLADIMGGAYNTERKQAGETGRVGMREAGATNRTGMQQEGAMDRVDAQQEGAMDRTGLMEQGKDRRLAQGQTNALELGEQKQTFGLENLGKKAEMEKESDVRGLGLDAVKQGINSPQVENLVNYQGEQGVPALGDVNFPQEQPKGQYGFEKVGQYDEKGKKIGEQLVQTNSQTGAMGSGQPGEGKPKGQGTFTEADVLVAENTFGKNFNPKQMTDEQLEYSNSLYESNPDLAEYLHQKYTQK